MDVDLLEHGRRVSTASTCPSSHANHEIRYRSNSSVKLRIELTISPFTYCYPVIYMMRAPSASYEFSLPVNIAMFLTLITCYIIFDGSMAQKSAFKLQQQGDFVPRGAFPQVPWSVVKNPTYVQTKHGNKLLTGGWWQFARKINYTSDWIQSVTWGLTGGLNTIITMWYPIFFLAVLVHRCERDFKKCSRKYGEDWDEYCRIVKYKFIPGVY